MTAQPADTGAALRVRQIANLAMTSDNGIVINFHTRQYGSMETCAQMARSLQTSFSSMRAKDRKIRNVGTPDNPRSRLDILVCERTPLADNRGWTVTFYKSANILDEWDIVDRVTGQSLRPDEKDRLIKEFAADPQGFWNDKAKLARIEELDPGFREGALEFFTPAGG